MRTEENEVTRVEVGVDAKRAAKAARNKEQTATMSVFSCLRKTGANWLINGIVSVGSQRLEEKKKTLALLFSVSGTVYLSLFSVTQLPGSSQYPQCGCINGPQD